MDTALLEMKDITKVFAHGDRPVRANDRVSLSILKGEIHAIVGENGAGKTTLMNVLYGLQQPDSGEIWLNGRRVSISSPHKAIELGVGMVHQHFTLLPSLSVTENIVLGSEPHKGFVLDRVKAVKLVRDLSRQYGLEVDPLRKIIDCPLAVQQRVEILKTLLRNAGILILDEPTAVLTPQETEELFCAMRSLAREGKTVIFITHKLAEVMAVSDRITVLRKGQVKATVPTGETSVGDLARLMIGRDLASLRREQIPRDMCQSPIVLEAEGLRCRDDRGLWALDGVSFQVHQGEILGVAGVGGNGQGELVEAIAGLRPLTSGRIVHCGEDVTRRSPFELRKRGIGHVTGRRYERGVCKATSLANNLIIGMQRRKPLSRGLVLDPRQVELYAKRLVEKFDIKASGIRDPIMNLSGGNVQKSVVARELSLAGRLLIAEEPTRGVDVGAKEFIHQQLLDRQAQGYGVLLVSTDLEEIMALSTRILVMHRGRVAGQRMPGSVTPEELGLLMTGGSD